MLEFVQITAQYSNAVLVAVLPYVTDFSRKLDLPVDRPVTTNMVREFKCDNRKGKVGGLVVLTNGVQFTYLDGRVCVFRSPWSYYSLQNPNVISKFYGDIVLNEADALKIAHETIKKLGYTDSTFFADRPPKVTPPETIQGKHIPRYRFQWLDPNRMASRNMSGSVLPVVLDMEVDARNGQVQMFSTISKNTVRPGPKVDISPPSADNPFKKNDWPPSGKGIPTQPVSRAYADEFLRGILPQLTDFVHRAGLAVSVPITMDQIDMPKYSCRLLDGKPNVQIYLKNGDRFNYDHGHVCSFYGHDAFLKFPYHGNSDDFMGKNHISENEARILGEKTLRSLGYSGPLADPAIESRKDSDSKEFTRRVFFWGRPSSANVPDVGSVEVDLETKTIKAVDCDDPTLWRDQPKLSAPIQEKQ